MKVVLVNGSRRDAGCTYTALSVVAKELEAQGIVLDGDGNRVSSDHYTVSYQAGRKKVGQYHVNVKMKNKYCGSKTLSFKIVPKATKITKVIKKKKVLSISWKKQKKQVSGYQIQVSTSRKFHRLIIYQAQD